MAPVVEVTRPEVKVELSARSISKPVSLLALSVHLRLIWLLDAAVAVRPEGAAGVLSAAVAVVRKIAPRHRPRVMVVLVRWNPSSRSGCSA